MRVIKRSGGYENVSFDKVLNRLQYLSDGIEIDICEIAQKVCGRIYDGVHTSDLDELAAHLCSSLVVMHPDYGRLASKIIISNHHKNTSPSFSETIHLLYHNPASPLVSKELYEIVQQHKEKLNSYIDYSRDYLFDYFGFKTLERSYLLKVGGKIVERPQHMWMRVALGIHANDIREALQTYDMMSQKYFTHATPTLFNAGTPHPQNSSCFLLSMKEDSIAGIYDSLKEVAMISKHAGGIGIHMHQVRARGSVIRGNNGISSGIIPMLRVFNNTARYVDQAGKRPGSIAVYIEPWHADIEQFLELRKNHGNEEERCRDLFLALWVCDLFMKRVKENGVWSLMCPDRCRGLSDVWGKEFEDLYTKYEVDGMYVKQINAQDLWFKILEAQIETGVPYICYKDASNSKSNQQNIGTIKSSNLCVAPETMILTEEGYFQIQKLKDMKVKVWNGHEFSETTVRQTGTKQKLMTIGFSNGMTIRCTPYHKFHIQNENSLVDVVDAKDLVVGSKLINYETPILKTGKHSTHDLHLLNDVPINCDLEIKLRWLEGFVDGATCVLQSDIGIKISSNDKEFLTNVFYLLQTLGVNASISGEQQPYRLTIDYANILHLHSLGFSPKQLDLKMDGLTPHHEKKIHVMVERITDSSEYDDTYCFHEPIRHTGIFNGILTGQCTEIMEVSTPEECAVCLTGDTEILTEDGICQLKDLDDSQKVFSYFDNDDRLIKKENLVDATLIDNGVRDVYEISFFGSKPVKATANHKFLVFHEKDKYIWKEVKDLTMNDRVVMPSHSPLEKYKNINIENDVNRECLSLGWTLGKNNDHQNSFLHQFNEMKPYQLASVLSGYFSANGFVYLNIQKKDFYVFLSCTIEGLLYQVQSLLRCFGIQSRIVFQSHLLIYERTNLQRFQQSINFMLCDVKKSILEKGLDVRMDQPVMSDLEWSRVRSITYIGKEQVYDLCVPQTHNFIANGMVTHNCNLASICLPTYIENKVFNFQKLHESAKILTKNLNKVIDRNFYPLEIARVSNLRHRPIGIGVNGLADVYMMLRMPYESPDAKELNRQIFETIYHGALEYSMELSKKRQEIILSGDEEKIQALYLHPDEVGLMSYVGAYTTFNGSPASQGILQFDMWGVTPSGMYDWDKLRQDIKKYGIRNSLLLAPMPTASTSQIMGFQESFEPITSNIYKRKTLSGEFIVVNKHLINDLIKLGLWNNEMKDKILLHDGSVQHIDEIPATLKEIYKTVWEIKQKNILDMAADRGAFICQSQSLNIFMEDPDFKKLSSMHFYGWSKGLKTGSYYIRTKPKAKTQQFTIDPTFAKKQQKKVVCTEEVCTSCSA